MNLALWTLGRRCDDTVTSAENRNRELDVHIFRAGARRATEPDPARKATPAMEYIILAVALLIMAPVALLPFINSMHDTMEADLRMQAPVTPARVHPVMPQSVAPGIEHRQAA